MSASDVLKVIPVIAVAVAIVATVLGYLRVQYSRRSAKREKSEQIFKDSRRYLSQNRQQLARDMLSAFYSAHALEPRIPLIFEEGWLPKKPLSLKDVRIALESDEKDAYSPKLYQLNCQKILPYANIWNRFSRYSDAIREIDKPKLFKSLISYRLKGIEASEGILMNFGKCYYFDYINTGETLCYELARKRILLKERKYQKLMSEIDLMSVRRQVKDAFDFKNRAVIPGINTLTICENDGGWMFFMHIREAEKVASAMGTFHVAPAGEFQPAADNPIDFRGDFEIWKTVIREYNEEFLGAPSGEELGKSPDYENEEPYRSLNIALRGEDLRVFFLGVGLDPLSLKGEILTVCIFKQDVFNSIFEKMIEVNNEGRLIVGKNNNGIPFTKANVEDFVKSERTLPAAIGCLVLAWRHREHLFA